MDTVVTESGVTLDSRFFREDVVVLAFEVTDDFRKAILMLVWGYQEG